MRAPTGSRSERFDGRSDGALEHVVRQHDEHGLSPGEVGGEAECFGDAAGPLLVGVGQLVDAVLAPVAQQAEELPGVGAAGHEHDLVDPRRDDRLDRPRDHGPVVDGQKVLVGDPGERVQAGSRAPGEDDSLHRVIPDEGSVSMTRLPAFLDSLIN